MKTVKLITACFLLSAAMYLVAPLHAAPKPESTPTEKNDCVIVATEAYKRLQSQGIWAEIIAFDFNLPSGKKNRHAVCIFQPSKTSNIQLYEAQIGTFDLKTQSADLASLEQGYNRYLNKAGYSVSNLEVLVQEPTKARVADSQLQPPKRIAPIATRSRAPSRPAPTQQQIPSTESLLLRSGFKAIKVNTAKLQRTVNELRQGKMSYMNYNGQLYYVYPAATRDKVYIGTQAQFNAFAGVRSPMPASEPQALRTPNMLPPATYDNPLPPTPPYLR